MTQAGFPSYASVWASISYVMRIRDCCELDLWTAFGSKHKDVRTTLMGNTLWTQNKCNFMWINQLHQPNQLPSTKSVTINWISYHQPNQLPSTESIVNPSPSGVYISDSTFLILCEFQMFPFGFSNSNVQNLHYRVGWKPGCCLIGITS